MDWNQELKWRSILRVESFETGSGRLWHKALSSSLSLQTDKVWCVILPVLTTVPYPRKGLPLCGEPLESPAAAEIRKWSRRSARVHSFPLPLCRAGPQLLQSYDRKAHRVWRDLHVPNSGKRLSQFSVVGV